MASALFLVANVAAGCEKYYLWQYTDEGTIAGVTPPTDLNQIQPGITDAEFLSMWSGGAAVPIEPVEPIEPIEPRARRDRHRHHAQDRRPARHDGRGQAINEKPGGSRAGPSYAYNGAPLGGF